MAAFQRLFRAALVPSAAVGAVAAASASVALADDGAASPFVQPGRSARGDKLPIYSNPEGDEPVTLVLHHNPLSEHIGVAREYTAGAVGEVRNVVQQGVSSWIDFERSVEREVKTVLPKDENLTPGIIYVLVAGLTGSVLTRTRAFPIRFLAPPTFSLLALPYFLPKTAHNLRRYVSDVEDKHAPEFAAKHDQFNQNLEMHWDMALDRLRGAGHEARHWSSKAVQGVESATGLRVSDHVKLNQGIESAKNRVADATAVAREKLHAAAHPAARPVVAEQVVYEKVGTVMEQKPIAEIVVPVSAGPDAPTVVVDASEAPSVVSIEPVETREVKTAAAVKPAADKRLV